MSADPLPPLTEIAARLEKLLLAPASGMAGADRIETIHLAARALRECDAKRWLAFDVGCIECGEESNVIGVFASREEAEVACENAGDEQRKNWTGQHSMEVFDLRPPSKDQEP